MGEERWVTAGPANRQGLKVGVGGRSQVTPRGSDSAKWKSQDSFPEPFLCLHLMSSLESFGACKNEENGIPCTD